MENKTDLRDLENDLKANNLENAGMETIFPYGFKIVEMNNAKLLQPLDINEFIDSVRSDLGEDLSIEEAKRRACGYSRAVGCINHNCTGTGSNGRRRQCQVIGSRPGVWYCICNNP